MTPDPELLDCFRDEVGGYLPAIAEALARSEATVTPDDLERLHRHAHSVKGSAALLGFTELATVAGDLEALFERVTGGGPWTPATHAAAAGLVDAIVIHLEALDTPPETPTGSDNAVPAELLEVFALEAAEHLATIRTVLPELRDRPRDKERLQEVRRAAHTLKGAAAMVGFKAVTRLAHTMEDALDAYYESADGVPAAMLPTLMRSADYLADLADGTPAEESRLAALLTEYDGVQVAQCVTLDAESPRTEPVSRGELSLRVPVARLDGVARLVGDLVQERAAFAQRTAEYGAMLEELRLAAARMRRAARQLERESELRVAPVRGTAHGFDDLEFDRYTDLNLLSRELAETTSDIAAIGGELAHLFGDIDGYLARETTLTRDIQETLTRARLVPLSTLGVSLERTVRTVAESRGKAARFVLDGGSTELDKTVLDELAEPLLHLLRNAVDHGLEPPDVRLAAGKPAAGTVTVRATQVGTQVVVTVADDGGGVDLARVRAKAVANGLIDADAGLSEAEALELLFRAGFSTAAELSEVSGRGVGLDIVRAKVEKLKGTLALASVPGVGATFTVRLPLTLAVTRALLVRAAGQTFALPLAAVERVVHLDEAGEWIAERGLETVTLADALGLPVPADAAVGRPVVAVVATGDGAVGLVVDRVLGGREVVVKGLGSHVKRLRGFSGATVTGDGRVVLILDPAEWSAARRPRAAGRRMSADRPRRVLTALVVDDSPSVRRVLAGRLTAAGINVAAAKDGQDALEQLQHMPAPPDVILSDIEMPRMDGYELLATVRRHPEFGRLPVVMITSRAGEKHRAKAAELGASAYLVKPYRDGELLELIGRLTGGRLGSLEPGA